ncbi:MAG: ferritin-like domain-containing protein [Anaerolineae bacterium]|nr:ferritin-like domain-containing protein [Anaerolineae bacterium]
MTQTSAKFMLSRRDVLKGAALGAGAGLLGWKTLFGISRAFAQEMSGENDDLQTIVNLAATAELFASTHYLAAINAAENGDLDLDQTQVDYLKTAFISERDHYDLLLSLGAQPVVTEFYVPDGLFSDKAMFAQITEVAETTFVSAYLAAARIFTEMGETAFAVTAAQISGVEAEHRALVRQIGMQLPNDRSYQAFQFANVSGAVPVLRPFLDGSGDGFVGPVAPPTDDEVAAIRAQSSALGYDGSIQPYAAMAPAMASSGGSESDMSGAVMVTAFGQNVNIRSMPSTTSSPVGVLAANTATAIDGQRMGDDGYTWWRVTGGGWVREDTVDEQAGAADLPMV